MLQTAASPEHYGLYYSNDIYYKPLGFISYLFLISMLLFQLDIKELKGFVLYSLIPAVSTIGT